MYIVSSSSIDVDYTGWFSGSPIITNRDIRWNMRRASARMFPKVMFICVCRAVKDYFFRVNVRPELTFLV